LGSPKDATKSAPKPFHTSRLLQVASNVLHISPKETMNLCQMLYQAGYITYMRTYSKTYSKDFIESAKKYIDSGYGANYINKDIDLLASGESEQGQHEINHC
jgi:DNA topoisomerase-1